MFLEVISTYAHVCISNSCYKLCAVFEVVLILDGKGRPCDGRFQCEEFYTCREGRCQSPTVLDYCSPYFGARCPSVAYCDKTALSCIG